MSTLETQRLILRLFTARDLDPYAQMCADPEVMRFLGGRTWTPGESWRQMAAILGHWQLLGYGMWALEERQSGAFVGRVGFIDPPGWPGFELGWALAPPFWGQGLAFEAAEAALEHAFLILGRDHVISLIHPNNTRSLRLAKRLGEKFERTVDFFGDEVGVYGIDRAAWEAAGVVS
jgi:RimJ/RimL family protein N-acetyltransferase